MLAKFVALFRADELLESMPENVGGDFFKLNRSTARMKLLHASMEFAPDRATTAAHSLASGKKTGS